MLPFFYFFICIFLILLFFIFVLSQPWPDFPPFSVLTTHLAVFGLGHQGSSVVLGTVCVQVRTLLVHTPDSHTAFLLSSRLVTRPP